MTEGQINAVTWLLIACASVPAFFAWRKTADLGTKLTVWKRRGQRAAFTGLVFFAVLGFLAYALWKVGVPIRIGAVKEGNLPPVAWVSLVTVVWAALTYMILLMNTPRGSHETPS